MRTANKFVAFLAAACLGHASHALAESGVDQAKVAVEKAKSMPQFVAPGQSFDISKLKGKHVWIITSTLAVPFVATIAHGAEAAAKEAGLTTTLFDGKGEVTERNRGMSQAVAQHADGIITVGMRHEFKTLRPDCGVTVQDTQVGNLGVKLGQLTQTLLRRSPDVTLVLPTYDAQGIYLVPAIKAANLDKTVEVIGSDAVTEQSRLDPAGRRAGRRRRRADVWAGWAAVDEIARAMLDLPSVEEGIPLRLFTADNLKDVSNDENALFGGDFVAQCHKLWACNRPLRRDQIEPHA